MSTLVTTPLPLAASSLRHHLTPMPSFPLPSPSPSPSPIAPLNLSMQVEDILIKIFSELDLYDLQAMRLVCVVFDRSCPSYSHKRLIGQSAATIARRCQSRLGRIAQAAGTAAATAVHEGQALGCGRLGAAAGCRPLRPPSRQLAQHQPEAHLHQTDSAGLCGSRDDAVRGRDVYCAQGRSDTLLERPRLPVESERIWQGARRHQQVSERHAKGDDQVYLSSSCGGSSEEPVHRGLRWRCHPTQVCPLTSFFLIYILTDAHLSLTLGRSVVCITSPWI